MISMLTNVPIGIVMDHLQDPYYCVWHEENVSTFVQLLTIAPDLFAYCDETGMGNGCGHSVVVG